MKILSIPNILSLSRLVLLPYLLFLVFTERNTAMLISYILIGSTDYFDGMIAKKLNQVTDLGKTLDSVADLFFYLATAFFLYRFFPDVIMANFALLMVFFGLLFLSFVVSFIRCGKPLLMHTTLLRYGAVLVYFLFILSFFFNTTILTAAILVYYLVAFVEEILIFIIYGEVDPDTKWIFSLRR